MSMSKERELLERVWASERWDMPEDLQADIQELLAQPEQTEQEPVAGITEWVQRYRHNDTAITDRAVSFTKGDAPAVPHPKYIPLYLAPPKREPLSHDEIVKLGANKSPANEFEYVRLVEKTHGITDIDTYRAKVGLDE